MKVDECLSLALSAIGVDTVLGRELRSLAADFSGVRMMEQLDSPLLALKQYLMDIQ
ncbi:hypothetical protein D3C84_1297830 [compost metagenome]